MNRSQMVHISGVLDGNFSDDDTAPTEDQTNGLTMDWSWWPWYWGYYIGKEYAADAFIYARKYAPSDYKLYINDYNLETSPGKLAALIDFVKYIDENGGKVDGIGAQMHVSSSIIVLHCYDVPDNGSHRQTGAYQRIGCTGWYNGTFCYWSAADTVGCISNDYQVV